MTNISIVEALSQIAREKNVNRELGLDCARGVLQRRHDTAWSRDIPSGVRQWWRLVLGRAPDHRGLAWAITCLDERAARSASDNDVDRANDALLDLCHVLINTNEFLYVD